MKLLLFSDLHTNVAAAERLVGLAKEVDVVIAAGDFANMRQNVSACLDVLQQIEHPTVLVPGNNESLEELIRACAGWPAARVLHGTGLDILGVHFFGIGGGIPVTPFGSWSFDFSEDQARQLLANCPSDGVLVSHSPPKGAADEDSSGRSLGSIAVRETILRLKPRLVVCGHIHASAKRSCKINDTTVINAGPEGVLFTL